MKAYKVMTCGLRSCVVDQESEYRSLFSVQYKVGEWVKPNIPKTYLCVFKSLDSALWFRATCSGNCVIYTCEIKKARSKISCLCGVAQDLADWLIFWNTRGRKCSYRLSLPHGTKFATEVKILDEVTNL